MKTKNIAIVLLTLLVVFAGYLYYKKSKQDEVKVGAELSQGNVVGATATESGAEPSSGTPETANTDAPATPAESDSSAEPSSGAPEATNTDAPATPAASDSSAEPSSGAPEATNADTPATPAVSDSSAESSNTESSANTGAAPAAPVSETDASNVNTVTKNEVVNIVRDELKNHPEIIVEALKDHANAQQKEEQRLMSKAVKDNNDALVNNDSDPKYGNSSAKGIIVHYYDYNCSYCKKMSEVIKKLIDEKHNVYIVFKELPVLGDSSVKASKAALAVNKIAPKQYLDFHFALMESRDNGNIDQKIDKIAKSLKINIVQLHKAMENKELDEILENNIKLATTIGIRGVPDIIINGDLYPGAISYEEALKALGEDNKN
ncbi:DsbA family protein [Candidatus Bandiella euplotis]|uniref:DbsA family protein n=1 Tax=Candidatus Bandiella euplotis TaxID=1664265 RepID=A0ABZ0UKL7_9RICK|nr:thioredoxin domain-containing protein [Candidatus Bandiella woodruffii]WPX96492.1 DbsA family protein [Candidatus Bandiella woodruffii]